MQIKLVYLYIHISLYSRFHFLFHNPYLTPIFTINPRLVMSELCEIFSRFSLRSLSAGPPQNEQAFYPGGWKKDALKEP